MTEFQIVLTTCPSGEVAQTLGLSLVQEGLAACVNILPAIQSIYKWKGKIETATEYLLLIKSSTVHYAAIETRLRALHPYELPEIIAVSVSAGSTDYLSWLHHPDN